jgi:hypothetical protein
VPRTDYDVRKVYVVWRTAPGGVADIFGAYASEADAYGDPVLRDMVTRGADGRITPVPWRGLLASHHLRRGCSSPTRSRYASCESSCAR